jgi:hypothetical protein
MDQFSDYVLFCALNETYIPCFVARQMGAPACNDGAFAQAKVESRTRGIVDGQCFVFVFMQPGQR